MYKYIYLIYTFIWYILYDTFIYFWINLSVTSENSVSLFTYLVSRVLCCITRCYITLLKGDTNLTLSPSFPIMFTFFISYKHIKHHFLNMLNIKRDINKKYFKMIDLHFFKSQNFHWLKVVIFFIDVKIGSKF